MRIYASSICMPQTVLRHATSWQFGSILALLVPVSLSLGVVLRCSLWDVGYDRFGPIGCQIAVKFCVYFLSVIRADVDFFRIFSIKKQEIIFRNFFWWVCYLLKEKAVQKLFNELAKFNLEGQNIACNVSDLFYFSVELK